MPGGDEERETKCMSTGRTLLSIGAGIVISVSAGFAVTAVRASYQKDTDDAQDRQITEVKSILRDEIRDLRADVKVLLQRGR